MDTIASLAKSNPCSIPKVPNIENQITENPAGSRMTPLINSPMVRPLDIRATKEPVNGAQAIHQAQ